MRTATTLSWVCAGLIGGPVEWKMSCNVSDAFNSSFFMSVYVSVCMSVYFSLLLLLFSFPEVGQPIRMIGRLNPRNIYISHSLSVSLSLSLSVCLSVCLPLTLPPSLSLSLPPPVCLSVCLALSPVYLSPPAPCLSVSLGGLVMGAG